KPTAWSRAVALVDVSARRSPVSCRWRTRATTGASVTAIDDKYATLGGAGGFLGGPTTPELPCPDLVGAFRHYEHGSIYWSPATGAHEVHGEIKVLWSQLGWEAGELGYPTSDEGDGPMS